MTQRVKLPSGIILAVDADVPSDRPTLLLSNSIGADLSMWDELVALMQRRARIIRYDTRGHGLSDVGDSPFTIETLGRDAIEILDHFEVRQAIVCGLSLGGLTAQWLATSFPDRFEGIILANTATHFPPPSLWIDRATTVRKQGIGPLVAPTLDRWFTKPYQEKHPDRMESISQMILRVSPEGYARCCEVLAYTDLSETVSTIAKPVQIICGRHDPSTTPARGEELAKLIPNAKLTILEAAHISSIEAAAEFANVVRSFVRHVHWNGAGFRAADFHTTW